MWWSSSRGRERRVCDAGTARTSSDPPIQLAARAPEGVQLIPTGATRPAAVTAEWAITADSEEPVDCRARGAVDRRLGDGPPCRLIPIPPWRMNPCARITEMDIYPAKANLDGRTVRNLRVRSSPTGTVVWQMDRVTQNVTELLRSDSPLSRVGASQRWYVDGVVLEQQRGCGCNHPMYTWVPPDET